MFSRSLREVVRRVLREDRRLGMPDGDPFLMGLELTSNELWVEMSRVWAVVRKRKLRLNS